MRLLQSWYVRAQTDAKALRHVLTIMRELARYQGIAEPKKVQHEHLTPVPTMERRYDYSKLTTDKLRTLISAQEMLEEAGVEILKDAGVPAPGREHSLAVGAEPPPAPTDCGCRAGSGSCRQGCPGRVSASTDPAAHPAAQGRSVPRAVRTLAARLHPALLEGNGSVALQRQLAYRRLSASTWKPSRTARSPAWSSTSRRGTRRACRSSAGRPGHGRQKVNEARPSGRPFHTVPLGVLRVPAGRPGQPEKRGCCSSLRSTARIGVTACGWRGDQNAKARFENTEGWLPAGHIG